MKTFSGKTAFITGGANGIGLALAQALLAENCNVVIADIHQGSLDEALQQLNSDKAMGLTLDVASRSAFAEAADKAEARFGNVSLLFNNAGVNLFQTIEDSSYDDWDWVMGVNLNGVINGVQTFVPRMLAHNQGGHIVNTASMASFLVGPVAGIYNCSKFAVRGLSESLRYSLAEKGLGVSVLCPGLVNSHIHASEEVRPQSLSQRGKDVDETFLQRLVKVQKLGMSASEVAGKTLKAIRENRFYIFSHPEFKQELREIFDEILAAMPAGEAPEARLAFENQRRERNRQYRQANSADCQ